ncbi:MAG TPA: hypothetical protein VKG43_03830 [Acidimicrobiales bacterium]|nr:hypothetical protein [Acidimicrobiales bacterium]
MAVVIDDHVLLRLLAGAAPSPVGKEAESGRVLTTGCWYFRLARVAGMPGTGSLSTQIELLEEQTREAVRQGLRRLPSEIGLFGWRIVVPVMAELRVRRQVNPLSAEALAVATLAEAELVVSTESPLLEAGAEDLGIPLRVIR